MFILSSRKSKRRFASIWKCVVGHEESAADCAPEVPQHTHTHTGIHIKPRTHRGKCKHRRSPFVKLIKHGEEEVKGSSAGFLTSSERSSRTHSYKANRHIHAPQPGNSGLVNMPGCSLGFRARESSRWGFSCWTPPVCMSLLPGKKKTSPELQSFWLSCCCTNWLCKMWFWISSGFMTPGAVRQFQWIFPKDKRQILCRSIFHQTKAALHRSSPPFCALQLPSELPLSPAHPCSGTGLEGSCRGWWWPGPCIWFWLGHWKGWLEMEDWDYCWLTSSCPRDSSLSHKHMLWCTGADAEAAQKGCMTDTCERSHVQYLMLLLCEVVINTSATMTEIYLRWWFLSYSRHINPSVLTS